jgi:hypothetical protein
VAIFLSPWNQVTGKFSKLFGLLETAADWWVEVVSFVGQKVFCVTITALPFGSGDTTFNYVEVFCWLAIAAAATLLWSIVDWRQTSYPRLFEALRVAVRSYLAYQMLSYGIAKVLPAKFGTLQPGHLVTPVGEMSPTGLLWTFMAASPAIRVLRRVRIARRDAARLSANDVVGRARVRRRDEPSGDAQPLVRCAGQTAFLATLGDGWPAFGTSSNSSAMARSCRRWPPMQLGGIKC